MAYPSCEWTEGQGGQVCLYTCVCEFVGVGCYRDAYFSLGEPGEQKTDDDTLKGLQTDPR